MSKRVLESTIFALVAAATVWTAAPAGAQSFLPNSSTTPTNPFATTAPSLAPAPSYGSGMTPFPSAAAPAWDPYAAPGSAAPPPALPAYGTQPAQPSLNFPFQDWQMPSTKLVQNVSFRNSWLNRGGNGSNNFGMTNVDLAASLAFPFFYNHNLAPLIVTPGFNFHFLQGPGAGPTQDLPGVVYDAFVQMSWMPQFTPRLGADLAVSVGTYTDFQYVDNTSVRVLGRGLGTWTFNPQWKGVLGVVYLNRIRTKILPAFGFIWTPHDDAKFELVFPTPRIAQRITNWGNRAVWGYIGGEYGGGQWSIAHSNDTHDVFNYNDLRAYLGIEAFGMNNMHTFFEVGYVFNREILYKSGAPAIEPGDTVMLRGGVSF
jgi:hypothetical protein